MIATASAPALAQWVACDGTNRFGYAQSIIPARPVTGVSRGWIRDMWRNNRSNCRTLGIGGWIIGVPLNAAYKISIADDSSDATVPTNHVVTNKPPGTKG